MILAAFRGAVCTMSLTSLTASCKLGVRMACRPNVPMFITESNLSSAASETYMDLFAGLWLADYIGSFLNAGGALVYHFHYLPLFMEHGCNSSPGTFGMFTVGPDYQIEQPLSQFFASQMINLEWVQPGSGTHDMYPAKSDVDDGAGHTLVTTYALKRPDGQWSLMIVNRDQHNAHSVKIVFDDQVGAQLRAVSPAQWRSQNLAASNISGMRPRPAFPPTRRVPAWRPPWLMCPATPIRMGRCCTPNKMPGRTLRLNCRQLRLW